MVRPLNTLSLPWNQCCTVKCVELTMRQPVDCELKERRHDFARETRNSVWLHGLCDRIVAVLR